MTTANELIRRAMRSIGVLHHAEEPTADEAADALQTLNDMLNGWIYDGIDLEFVDLALTDTVPYPNDHLSAFRYNLAVELCPEFGKQVPIGVAAMAGSTKKELRNAYLDPDELSIDESLLPRSNSNIKGFYS